MGLFLRLCRGGCRPRAVRGEQVLPKTDARLLGIQGVGNGPVAIPPTGHRQVNDRPVHGMPTRIPDEEDGRAKGGLGARVWAEDEADFPGRQADQRRHTSWGWTKP